ncbi:MAG: HD domain-containing protein [Bacteroidetes bacterium]|nr:HD domain-containing protein [Bacteroidota bacterium]
MEQALRKIINDPVYGFITINDPLIFRLMAQPVYQRLRRIHQMALAHLVYPGAVHSRLHHSLGAYHLMCQAVAELRLKGIDISPDEETAVKAAILLHDIGHGPYSHALEYTLIPGVQHETLSLLIMQQLNDLLDGELTLAIDIFTNQYHKPFLHQLISGQLDMDRMDYLTRDSFFTGVSEGVIGYARILKMLHVHEGQLMVEEKGIYSVEKFLVARRQMYWQVYLHKTVLASEKMLVKIMERVHELYPLNGTSLSINQPLDYFFQEFSGEMTKTALENFCRLDDADILFAIKKWASFSDPILSLLCTSLLNRKLYKTSLQTQPFNATKIALLEAEILSRYRVDKKDLHYYIFCGETANTTYTPEHEKILIIFKNGMIKNIAEIDNPLIHQTLSMPVKKFYICHL